MKRLTLLDYGVGNIHSIRKAFDAAGAGVTVCTDAKEILAAEALVLPGVGAFGAVAAMIAPYRDALRAKLDKGCPAFCVCIGMQILFETSEESPGRGIGLLPGQVRKLGHQRLPHIGWNSIEATADPMFEGVPPTSRFYFVHSFAPSACTDAVTATTEYGGRFASAVRTRNVWGVQFHPEKSSEAGLRVIRNFVGTL